MADDPVVTRAIIDNVLSTYDLCPFVTDNGCLGIMFGTFSIAVEWSDNASLIDRLQEWLETQYGDSTKLTIEQRENLLTCRDSLTATLMMVNNIMQHSEIALTPTRTKGQ